MSEPNFDQSHQKVQNQKIAGRDYHETYVDDMPYVEQEEYESAGCTSRALMITGGVLLAGGFLAFVGIILMTFFNFASIASTATAGQEPSLTPLFSSIALGPIGFGVMIVGGVIYVLGRLMARNSAYKNRRKTQRYSNRARY